MLALLSKYKYVMIVLLAGIVCLAWPSKDQAAPGIEAPSAVPASERQEILQLQQEMEDILGKMQGVGELRLMLTLDQGSSKALAQDASLNYSGAPAAPEDYSRSASTVVERDAASCISIMDVSCPRIPEVAFRIRVSASSSTLPPSPEETFQS